MKICIVAAGLATRLQPLTNYIPKFLINIGKQTGFVEMIRYWSEHSNDFTIIIHPKYEELTRAYFDMYFKDTDIKLTIKPCETALGTAHTIDTSLGMDYEDEDILFTWCDVIPSRPIDMSEVECKLGHGDGLGVFTVANGLNRYKYTNNTLIQANDGDVIGIYMVQNYKSKSMMNYVEGQDFADVLSKYFINQIELDDIIDFGDKPKLFEVLKTADEGREFNRVQIFDTLVLKTPLNDQGKTLIGREVEWYKTAHGLTEARLPKVYPSLDGDELVMERVRGESIFKIFSDVTGNEQDIILDNIFENFRKLHEPKITVPNDQVQRDVKKEAYDKLLARYSEIEGVVKAFGKNITRVNGVDIDPDPRKIIHELYTRLSTYYQNTDQYSLIHGDLQMSNSMVCPKSLEVTFIDPRGYFGDTKCYGLEAYDYAKLLYSLSGYDLFNYSTSFHLDDISDTEIKFVIPKPSIKTAYGVNRFTEVHRLWLAVCWIGLAQYIKNNPIKSIAAHYHGLALATKILKRDFTL